MHTNPRQVFQCRSNAHLEGVQKQSPSENFVVQLDVAVLVSNTQGHEPPLTVSLSTTSLLAPIFLAGSNQLKSHTLRVNPAPATFLTEPMSLSFRRTQTSSLSWFTA